MTQYHKKRDVVTTLTERINVEVRLVKTLATEEQIRNWNFNYLFLYWLPYCFFALMFVYCMSSTIFSLTTGHHLLVMWWPVDRPSYGFAWYAELVFQQLVIGYLTFFYTTMEVLNIDCILQLSFLYRVKSQQILQLSGKDPLCEPKLIGVCRELVGYKVLVIASSFHSFKCI